MATLKEKNMRNLGIRKIWPLIYCENILWYFLHSTKFDFNKLKGIFARICMAVTEWLSGLLKVATANIKTRDGFPSQPSPDKGHNPEYCEW